LIQGDRHSLVTSHRPFHFRREASFFLLFRLAFFPPSVSLAEKKSDLVGPFSVPFTMLCLLCCASVARRRFLRRVGGFVCSDLVFSFPLFIGGSTSFSPGHTRFLPRSYDLDFFLVPFGRSSVLPIPSCLRVPGSMPSYLFFFFGWSVFFWGFFGGSKPFRPPCLAVLEIRHEARVSTSS